MPSIPKRIKPVWGQSQRTGFQEQNRKTDERYHTVRWRKTRKLKLMQQPNCVECEKRGIISVATDVDHIEPMRQGDPDEKFWDLDGLQCLCSSHHKSKSAKERGDRRHG